ncbi:MAG TPA: 2'-5' RNA ligase family protein [Candidatus Saccharimonadales bacterium]|nr:2'-5' RNA ligase family protein [Candidatus Saccharimonadales bacterium]
MRKYTIVHFLKEPPDNLEFTVSDWPLHITLADDFRLEKVGRQLLSELSELTACQEPIKVLAIDDTYLGKHSETRVTLVDTSMELIELHKKLVGLLKKCGAEFYNPHYILGGYKPHITIQKSGRAKPGEVITINSLSLVDMAPGNNETKRKIIATMSFGASGASLT